MSPSASSRGENGSSTVGDCGRLEFELKFDEFDSDDLKLLLFTNEFRLVSELVSLLFLFRNDDLLLTNLLDERTFSNFDRSARFANEDCSDGLAFMNDVLKSTFRDGENDALWRMAAVDQWRSRGRKRERE